MKYRSSEPFVADIGVSQRLQTLGLGVTVFGGFISLVAGFAPSGKKGPEEENAASTTDQQKPGERKYRKIAVYLFGMGIVLWFALTVIHISIVSFFAIYAIGITIAALVVGR
jgi:hypothetical protein